MDEKNFSMRLSRLREQKKVSARKMSIDLCLNPGYINKIESQCVLPSMPIFFQICEYLNISPKEFFDDSTEHPEELREVIDNLQKLTDKQFNNIASIIEDLANTR